MTHLKNEQKAYIAGFLDGDGCINAQIVKRPDYKLHFQIRVTLTFFQKTKRHWILLQLQKLLKLSTIRKRNDGMSEYAIVGKDSVKKCLHLLYPYIKLKKVHARRVLQAFCHAKVAPLRQTRRGQKDVLRLDIPMQNFLGVHVL